MNVCTSCQNQKAPLECGICKSSLCKRCAQLADEDWFSFLETVPVDLDQGIFCSSCYFEKVEPELVRYNEVMDRAREVFVFFKVQSKETRLFKRTKEVLRVKDCADRDETLLRLAFLAAQKDYNTLIDVELNFDKTRDGSYQLITWNGVGVPVHGDAIKLSKG